jgi:hypothetical protein
VAVEGVELDDGSRADVAEGQLDASRLGLPHIALQRHLAFALRGKVV